MLLRKLLDQEFAARRGRNSRYSLRAFARDLGVHHSTLSRVLRGQQRATPETLIRIADRLRLAPDLVAESVLAEAEGAVLEAVRREGFRPESRWIAAITGLRIDEVNATLHRLLRKRMLRMRSPSEWELDT